MVTVRPGLLLTMVVSLLGLVVPAASARTMETAPSSSVSFNGTVRAMAVDGSTVYAVGDFTRALDGSGSHVRRHVAAIDGRTGELLPWNVPTNGPVVAVAFNHHRLYLAGDFTRAQGRAVSGVARVSTIDALVSSNFHPQIRGHVLALAATKHKVFLGGDFNQVNDAARTRLAAVGAKFGKLRGWAPHADAPVRVVKVNRGLVYVGGAFSAIDGDQSRGYLVALRKKQGGRLVRSFQTNLGYPVLGLKLSKYRIYVAGGGAGGKVAALDRTGHTTWARTFDGDVNAVAVTGNRLYVGGHWDNICTTRRVKPGNGDCIDAQFYRPRLASYTLNGKRTGWAPYPDSADGVLALASVTQRLSVGGDFDHFDRGNIDQPKFALFSQR